MFFCKLPFPSVACQLFQAEEKLHVVRQLTYQAEHWTPMMGLSTPRSSSRSAYLHQTMGAFGPSRHPHSTRGPLLSCRSLSLRTKVMSTLRFLWICRLQTSCRWLAYGLILRYKLGAGNSSPGSTWSSKSSGMRTSNAIAQKDRFSRGSRKKVRTNTLFVR